MNVLKPHQRTTVATLLEAGASQRQIGRLTGIDRKTIRAVQLGLAAERSNSPGVATGVEDPATLSFGMAIAKAFFQFSPVEGAPEPGASEALEGRRRSFEQQAGVQRLHIENLESAVGVPLQLIMLR